MRVNVYAEETTNRIEIITKVIEGKEFTALRFYLELPATVKGRQYKGPFIHHPGDDDSSAVTFWAKKDMRKILKKALRLLDKHYASRAKERKFEKRMVDQAEKTAAKFDRDCRAIEVERIEKLFQVRRFNKAKQIAKKSLEGKWTKKRSDRDLNKLLERARSKDAKRKSRSWKQKRTPRDADQRGGAW